MKTLLTLTLLATLFLTTTTTLAANRALPRESMETPRVPDKIPVPHLVRLQLHPMFLEMETIRKKMQEREDELLGLLLAATTDQECDLIINRLERLDTDWTLALLEVQARYAHREGRFDLEREVKHKINEVLVADSRPIQ